MTWKSSRIRAGWRDGESGISVGLGVRNSTSPPGLYWHAARKLIVVAKGSVRALTRICEDVRVAGMQTGALRLGALVRRVDSRWNPTSLSTKY